jgi:hypothetical protein
MVKVGGDFFLCGSVKLVHFAVIEDFVSLNGEVVVAREEHWLRAVLLEGEAPVRPLANVL